MPSGSSSEIRFRDEFNQLREQVQGVAGEVDGLSIQAGMLTETIKGIGQKLNNGFTERIARLEEKADRNKQDVQGLIQSLNDLDERFNTNSTATMRWAIGALISSFFGLAGLILGIMKLSG